MTPPAGGGERRGARLLLLAAGLGAALLLAEAGLRLAEPVPLVTIAPVDDPVLGYAHVPNFSGAARGWRLAYDARGLRVSPDGPPPAGRTRILFVGDSITDGRPEADSSYPALVGRLLRDAGADVETLNAGVTGYNIEQVRRSLEVRLAEVAPAAVVYGLCLNDLLERGEVGGEGEILARDLSPGALLRRSLLVRRLAGLVQGLLSRHGIMPPLGDYRAYGLRVAARWADPAERARFVGEVRKMRAACADSGAVLLVAVFPLANQYLGQDAAPQAVLLEALAAEGIPAVDLRGPIGAAGGYRVFVPGDPVHPDDAGHLAAARAIAEALRPLLLDH